MGFPAQVRCKKIRDSLRRDTWRWVETATKDPDIEIQVDRIEARKSKLGIVNRVVASEQLDEIALSVANHLAAIDPNLVKETKRAINRAYEARNMLDALEEALEIDLAIEGAGSPDKIQFMDIARREGLKAALAWRDARFPDRAT